MQPSDLVLTCVYTHVPNKHHRLLHTVPDAQVTIYASKFQSDVTTHGAAGVWMPYKLSETPEVLTDRWVGEQVGSAGELGAAARSTANSSQSQAG